MSKKIVLTGGGTAGHVTPNIAMIPELQKQGYDVSYIGSYDGIEKTLISELGIPYTGISSGKLRRYLSVQNLTDPFRVVRGFGEALGALKSIRPDVIFSKGGFVAVPVVLAAKQLKIPCVIHESDMTPGLANKLCMPFSKKLCVTFEDTLKYLPKKKAVYTGTPIRDSLLKGDRLKGFSYTGLDPAGKPVLMVVGGSSGAHALNEAITQSLERILEHFQVIHLYGSRQEDFERRIRKNDRTDIPPVENDIAL